MAGAVATAQTEIAAPPERVWAALTDPEQVRQYSFGATVTSDYRPGSPITWAGEFNGKPFEDKGEVLAAEPGRLLRVTHYSPLSGQPDEPASYHTVTYELTPNGDGTRVALTQDNAASAEEAEHSSATWQQMLDGLKRVAETA